MGFISQLATYIVQSPSMDVLFENIIENQRFPKGELVHLDVMEVALCRVIQRLTGRSDKTLSLSPPKCISTLMHWHFIAMILASIMKEQADSLKKGEWQEIPCSVQQQLTMMDGHFHPDQISMDKLYGVEQTLMELTNIPFLTLAIANCVYPSSWPKKEEIVQNHRFLYTISIHLHMVQSCNMSAQVFVNVAKAEPKCVRVGKVGLDYTTSCQCKHHSGRWQKEKCAQEKIQVQKAFLEDVLPQLKGVPTVLVIHTNGNDAAQDMVNLLEKHGLKQQAIYWHCFSGDKDLATQLCEWFDKLKLSTSSLVLSKPDIQEAVTVIPLEHLMLEADSLYLNPVDIGKVHRRE